MTLAPPKRPPDDEQRLVVLYALNAFSPCTETQLLQFLAEQDLMNYFDMMIALQDLCARGQAVRAPKGAGFLYQPTPAGREALQLFGGRVPASVKKLVQDTGDGWRRRFEEETQYPCHIRQTEQGDYELTLYVREEERDALRLSLRLPTPDLARRLAALWPRKAGQLYGALIRGLMEDEA